MLKRKAFIRDFCFALLFILIATLIKNSELRSFFNAEGFIYKYFGTIIFGILVLIYSSIIIAFEIPKESRKKLEKAARDLIKNVTVYDIFVPDKYQAANKEDFEILDLNYYNEVTRDLESLGFHLLGDFTDSKEARTAMPFARGVFRIFLGNEGQIFVNCFHYIQKKVLPSGEIAITPAGDPVKDSEIKTVSMFSKRIDKTFIETVRTKGPPSLTFAPNIDEKIVSYKETIPNLLREHIKRLTSGSVEIMSFKDINDYQNLVKERYEVAREYRLSQGINWYREYIKRLGYEKIAPKLLPYIKEILEKTAKK